MASCCPRASAKGPLPVREVVEVGLQVADALDEAHTRGIVHRDIKSANLMRTERGLVKVLDFGLAKFVATGVGPEVTQAQMTMAGMVVGTVSYMAPEQALGRTDRPSRRSLLARRRALRAAHRPDAVRRQFADRNHRPHPPRDAAAGLALHDRRAAGARRDRRARAREGSRLPLPVARATCTAIFARSREMLDAPPRSTGEPHRRGVAAVAIRELGRGDDVRQHHARASRTTGSGRASPRP